MISKRVFYNTIKFVRELVPEKSFRANVLTIMTGTTLAQAIPVIISPVLTRCYSPEDFGAFAIYIAVLSCIGTIATGRYELAIMLPKSNDHAYTVMLLSIIIVSCFSVIALLAILAFDNSITLLISQKHKWYYIIPLSVLLIGWHQAFTVWLNRMGRYGTLAINRVYQGVSTALVSVAMGFGHYGGIGLIAGSLAGQIVAIGQIFRNVWYDTKNKRNFLAKGEILSLAKRYKDFPKYDILSAFLNMLSNQIPIFLFGSFFDGVTVGFYALTIRVVKAPSALIGNSILEAFKQRASSDYNKYGNCRDIYLKTLKSLAWLAIIPTAILLFAAPSLFALVFGKQWLVAGQYAQIMSVMFFFGFISSPLSYVFFIAEKQFYNLIWQISLMLSTIMSILCGAYLKNIKISLTIFSVSYSILYLVYIAMSYKLSKGEIKEITETIVSKTT